MSKIGFSVSASSVAKKKSDLLEQQKILIDQLLLKEKRHYEDNESEANTISSSDIIGDNFDISINPSHMTKDKQRKSLHWFLLIGLQKRLITSEISNNLPSSTPIIAVENMKFLPSLTDCMVLEQNFSFHIMRVLVKYLPCFKKYEAFIPKYIDHPHMQVMSQKSSYAILDILDKSENKSEDMISILEHIHHNFIPHTHDDHPNVLRKKVFGGDVLTNERAYAAQLAMMNGATDFEKISGVTHRPEGLHRMMNLCLVTCCSKFKLC